MVGTATDGEFCSLRTQGETRMLHVWQAAHDAKESVSRMSMKTLLEMLLLINGEQLKLKFIHITWQILMKLMEEWKANLDNNFIIRFVGFVSVGLSDVFNPFPKELIRA